MSKYESPSYRKAIINEITPNRDDRTLCGKSLCACHFRVNEHLGFCCAFREAMLGAKRVSRCLQSDPELETIKAGE